jgi:hypothetical protein
MRKCVNSGGNNSIFLVKYDSFGTPLWGYTIKGTNVYVNCICIDNNNIYYRKVTYYM